MSLTASCAYSAEMGSSSPMSRNRMKWVQSTDGWQFLWKVPQMASSYLAILMGIYGILFMNRTIQQLLKRTRVSLFKSTGQFVTW